MQILPDFYSLFYLQSSLVIRSVSFKPDDGVDEDESGEGRKSGSDDGQCFGPTIGKEFAKEVVRLVEDANFRIHPWSIHKADFLCFRFFFSVTGFPVKFVLYRFVQIDN